MTHRLRNLAVSAVLVAPLLALPVAPAIAAETRFGAPGPWGGSGAWSYSSPYSGYGATPYGSTTPATGTATTQQTTAATDAESAGVVVINTSLDYGAGEAAGTGLVLSSDGIVVTNHHVVEGSTSVTVTDPESGTTYDAEVIGYDATADVAVLQLEDASGLTTVDTDTDGVTVGEDVTAVGNAGGTGSLTASSGDVTATAQDIEVADDEGGYEDLTDLVEVDAYIISGDSGGALLDADGEVVAMNVAASSGGYEVVGYAIPIETVVQIADQILDGSASGDIVLGYGAALGVGISEQAGGFVVAGVVEDSAAADAGITAGSTITALDGEPITSLDDLTTALATYQPGDEVTIGWTDADGTAHTATAELGRAPLA